MSKLRYSEMFYSLQGEGRYVGVPSLFLRLFGCNFECTGFGQDRDKSKWLDHDKMPHNQEHPDVKALVDLPVPHVGCDSSFSWGKKWGHLASNDDIDTLIKKMDVKWYGQKNNDRLFGDISQCTLQDDGVHLVITGGEPLLKGFQPGVVELITHPDLCTRFVTFETNGTQKFSFNDLIAHKSQDTYIEYHRKYGINKNSGVTFSVSPKLSNSGEKWSEAISPGALLSYNTWPKSYLYLKFVVRDEEDMKDVEQAVKTYDHAGVNIDAIYLMPETGDASVDTEHTVAQLALKYGYKYSPRLQINLFGNEWGT